jgi:hypothetical protein
MGRPWLFGIGKPKSGSNSLADALEILGLKCYHTGREKKAKNKSIHNQLLTNKHQGESPTKDVGETYDAIVDYPIHEIYKELYNENNDAKFILTYRPPDDIALSWCRMIMHKPQPLTERLPTNYSKFAKKAREHYAEVIEFFLDKPGRFLILDARDDDAVKWELLAKFLGKRVPKNKPYPHTFNHQKWETKKKASA